MQVFLGEKIEKRILVLSGIFSGEGGNSIIQTGKIVFACVLIYFPGISGTALLFCPPQRDAQEKHTFLREVQRPSIKKRTLFLKKMRTVKQCDGGVFQVRCGIQLDPASVFRPVDEHDGQGFRICRRKKGELSRLFAGQGNTVGASVEFVEHPEGVIGRRDFLAGKVEEPAVGACRFRVVSKVA